MMMSASCFLGVACYLVLMVLLLLTSELLCHHYFVAQTCLLCSRQTAGCPCRWNDAIL